MLTWLRPLILKLVDQAIHRTLKNPRSTLGGGAIAVAMEAAIQYLASQGCDVSAVQWLGLAPFVQGALATDANKVTVRTPSGALVTTTGEAAGIIAPTQQER